MTDAVKPSKKKIDLEHLVKANGGKIYQRRDAAPDTLCVGDKSGYYDAPAMLYALMH